jgi:hypothetical protein
MEELASIPDTSEASISPATAAPQLPAATAVDRGFRGRPMVFDHDWRAASAPRGCSPGLAVYRLRTVVQLKELMPEDAPGAFRHSLRGKCSKSGAVSSEPMNLPWTSQESIENSLMRVEPMIPDEAFRIPPVAAEQVQARFRLRTAYFPRDHRCTVGVPPMSAKIWEPRPHCIFTQLRPLSVRPGGGATVTGTALAPE